LAEPGDRVAESKVADAGKQTEPKSENDDRQSWAYDWHDGYRVMSVAKYAILYAF
jgi:hypothetical protein